MRTLGKLAVWFAAVLAMSAVWGLFRLMGDD
jgi:hypothetical protein